MKAAPRARSRPVRPDRRRSPSPRELVATALRGPAVPLDRATRALMERRIGHAFGHVRVHADDRAAAAADALGADAFTHGADVAFAAGRYRPHTAEGQRLLAHELVHTLQQGRGASPVTRQLLRGSTPGAAVSADPLEREAAVAADRVATGATVPPGLITLDAPAARNRVARQATLAPPAPVEHDDAAAVPEAVTERGVEVPSSPEVVAETAAEVEDLLVFDPDDAFGRVRRRLAQLAPLSRQAVVERAAGRAGATGGATLARLLRELAPPATEQAARDVDAQPAGDRDGAEAAESSAAAPEQAREIVDQPNDGGPTTGEAAAAQAAGVESALGEPADLEPAETQPVAREDPAALADAATAPPLEGGVTQAEPEAAPGTETAPEEAATEPPAGESAAAAPPAATPAPEGGAAATADPAALDALETEAVDRISDAEAEPAPTGAAAPPATAAGAPAVQEAGAEPGAEPQAQDAELATPGVEPAAERVDEVAAEARAPSGEPPAPDAQADFVDEGPTQDEGAEEHLEAPSAAEERADREAEPTGDEGIAAEAEPLPEPEPGEASEQDESTALAESAGAAPTGDEGASEPAGEEGATAVAEPEMENGTVAAAEPDADAGDADMGGEVDGGGAGFAGGAGGGEAIEDPPEPEVPEVGDRDPVEAMAVAGSLPPAQAQQALGGVASAASRSVADQRSELAASPPQLERPSGAPTPEERAAEQRAEAAAASTGESLDRVDPGTSAPAPAPTPLQVPSQAPLQAVRAPEVRGGEQGEMSEDDARALRSTIRQLPTSDPALSVTAGPAPRVPIEGNADPDRAREQRGELTRASQRAAADGLRDAAEPLGEQDLYPHLAPETLQAQLPSAPSAPAAGNGASPGGAGSAAAAGGAGAADPRVASIIAQEQRGDELRAAAAQARGDMVARREEHVDRAQQERTRADEEIAAAVRDNASQQTAARREARADVREQRRDWRTGQNELTTRAHDDADSELTTGVEDVERERNDAEETAVTRVEEGDQEAQTTREDAERTAREERERGERETESSGFFGWLASRARAFFDGIKRAIQRAFEAARAAVRRAIERAKQLAVAAIEAARQAIVAVIRRVGDALIAIGDRLLAGFPQLRDRFRRGIEERVRRAEAAVNSLADGLKEGVQRALDALGAALDAALGLLERGLLAVVDAYRAVVVGALEAANAVVQALAAFAALVGDVAAGPLRWLRNLGAAAVDGVRNHLWGAFQRAIKRWFNEKLDEVLGLGLPVWRVLRRGGISLARVGRMAWSAIKSAIPTALVQILIEKLVALIIPAAGAVMAIIEGLQAAWGTVQRILQAFQRFFAFLRAVKTGRAGPQFAEAVAAAAVVVIDFVANWLLARLRRPAGAIAARIRAIAQRLGRRLGRVARGIGRRLRGRRRGALRRPRRRRPARRPDRRARAERRVRAAADFLGRQLSRGMPYPILRAQMAYARLRYRVRARLTDCEETALLSVEANPRVPLPLVKRGMTAAEAAQYRERAEALLTWLMRHHDLHHILPKEPDLSRWWNALRIDYNHPTLMLELPPFLHQSGVHKGYRKLRVARDEHRAAVRDFQYGWNAQWTIFMRERMKARRIYIPQDLRDSGIQLRRNVRDEINHQIDVMIGRWSGKLGYDLKRFRVSAAGGAHYRERYRKPLQSLINGMRASKKAWQIRKRVSDWIAGKTRRGKLTRAQARNQERYWKGRAL